MKTIFSLASSTVTNGYLLTANFVDNKYGVIKVYRFSSLKIDEQQEERVYFNISDSKLWAGIQEPEGWSEMSRMTEPYNRSSSKTYLGFDFERFNFVLTSNNSRFLSLITPFPGGCYTSADERDDELALVLADKSELDDYLSQALVKLGVPDVDVDNIKALAFKVLS